jgi:hypothetical protein
MRRSGAARLLLTHKPPHQFLQVALELPPVRRPRRVCHRPPRPAHVCLVAGTPRTTVSYLARCAFCSFKAHSNVLLQQTMTTFLWRPPRLQMARLRHLGVSLLRRRARRVRVLRRSRRPRATPAAPPLARRRRRQGSVALCNRAAVAERARLSLLPCLPRSALRCLRYRTVLLGHALPQQVLPQRPRSLVPPRLPREPLRPRRVRRQPRPRLLQARARLLDLPMPCK